MCEMSWAAGPAACDFSLENHRGERI
jgi:hypothetical protein